MKTHYDQLTDLEKATYNAYNDILRLCTEPMTNAEMQKKGIKYIRNTITYKCRHLCDKGMMEYSDKKVNGVWFKAYKTLIPVYPFDDFLAFINAKHYNQIKVQREKAQQLEEKAKPTPGARIIDLAEIEAKQMETARLDRLNRKREKVYASHWGYNNA